MQEKFQQLIKTLSELGLDTPSRYIYSVEKLEKLAAINVASEIKVLTTLANLTEELQGMNFHDVLDAPFSFPGYTIETERKTIVKDEESLQGYTKLEIYLGLQNYLAAFIKYHMKPREAQIYHEYRRQYSQVIEGLEKALHLLAKTNRSVVRGVSKESVAALLDRTLRTASQIMFYLHIIKRDIDKFPSMASSPYKPLFWGETLTVEEQKKMQDEAKELGTWGAKLKSLSFDLNAEMSSIEQEFMQEHHVSPQMMQQMLKAFRPDVSSLQRDLSDITQIRKASTDDDEDLVFEAPSTPQKPSPKTTPPDQIKDLKEQIHKEHSEKQKKIHEDLEKAKDKPEGEKPKGIGLSMFEGLQRQPDRPTEKDDLKDMVLSIISNGSLRTKGQLVNGARLERGFSRYLLPLFRIQYVSLLDHALNVYTSIYQVQNAQKSLSEIFRRASRKLEELQ